MSWFPLFKKKKAPSTTTYTFTDEDREAAAEKKRMAALMREQNDILERELKHQQQMIAMRQKQEQIREMKEMLGMQEEDDEDDDYGEEPDEITEILKNGAAMVLQRMQPPKQAPAAAEPVSRTLTDEQIKAFLSAVPSQYLKAAQKMDDEKLRTAIIGYAPSLNADSVQRTMQIIRGGQF